MIRALKSRRKIDEVPWVRAEELAGWKLPRPIVVVNGAFDLLHSSHMRLIWTARAKAETLICGLDSDQKVAKAKGAERPIMTWVERATALGYLPLDYIVEIESREHFQQLLEALKPDARVIGEEYNSREVGKIPKLFVQEGAMHTSVIIERILGRYK